MAGAVTEKGIEKPHPHVRDRAVRPDPTGMIREDFVLKLLPLLTAGLALAAFSTPGYAEYPDRAITMINSSRPGSTGDVLARTIAKSMERSLGVPINVEGKGDAMYELVKASPPDGYTLAAPTISIVLVPSLSTTATFNIDDFEPVAHIGAFGSVFGSNPSLGVKDLEGLIEASKSEDYFYGYSGGVAITFTELLKQATGLKADGIPYDNANEGTAALLSNEVQMYYTGVTNMSEHILAGTIQGLFVSGKKRHPLIPDVPTLAEAGFPDLEALEQWNGLYAPKGTPPEIVEKLNAAVRESFKDPEVIEAFDKLYVTTYDMSVEEFDAYVHAESDRWKKVIETAGIRMD
jgi:tripartite-type tricarboxylate transporter receptor subunit TctC